MLPHHEAVKVYQLILELTPPTLELLSVITVMKYTMCNTKSHVKAYGLFNSHSCKRTQACSTYPIKESCPQSCMQISILISSVVGFGRCHLIFVYITSGYNKTVGVFDQFCDFRIPCHMGMIKYLRQSTCLRIRQYQAFKY